MSAKRLGLLVLVLYALQAGHPASADIIIRTVNRTYENATNKDATAFQVEAQRVVNGFVVNSGGIMTNPPPWSSAYDTIEQIKEKPYLVKMYDGTVAAGKSHKIFLQYSFDNKKRNVPLLTAFGTVDGDKYFTSFGDGSSKLLALDGNLLNQGNLASLALMNDSGFALGGTVGVFVETGRRFLDSPDQFDQPHNETILSPTQAFSLSDGGALNQTPITTSLSDDQYLLVRGTVVDSTGTYTFSDGFAIAAVPEPSPLLLGACAATAGLGVWWLRRLLRRGTAAPVRPSLPAERTAGVVCQR
jgi:hypothetical protein